MDVLILVLVVISFIVCLLMIGAILLQEDKSGGGLGIIGGSSQSFFGANSGTILVRITTVLFVVFLVLMLVIGLMSSSFTKGSVISEKDITASETEEYVLKKKTLKEAPAKINVVDFENSILNKIQDENDKSVLNALYKKDSSGKYFVLNEKSSKEDIAKVLKILNSIGFKLEAETTILEEKKDSSMEDGE